MTRQRREPLPADTPWVFRRITSGTNAPGRQGRVRGGTPSRVTSPRAKNGRKPAHTAERWSR